MRYRTRAMPRDTDPRAQDVQVALLRAAGPERRLDLALELSSNALRSSMGAVRERHPELDERGVLLRWAEVAYGSDLAARVRAQWERRG